jgi:hypothetical protein
VFIGAIRSKTCDLQLVFKNELTESQLRLKDYMSTELPLFDVPDLLAPTDASGDEHSVMLKIPQIGRENSTKSYRFAFRYRYEHDDTIGFDIDMLVRPHWSWFNPSSPVLIDIETNLTYRQSDATHQTQSKSRLHLDGHWHIKSDPFSIPHDTFHSAFVIDAKYLLISEKSPNIRMMINIKQTETTQ